MVALGCSLPGSYPSREALLDAAVNALGSEGLAVAGRSAWWTSAAWPDPAAPAYLNGVVLVETALDAALEIAERIRAEVEVPYLGLTNQLIAVTVSLGVAGLQDNMDAPEKLIAAADEALYQAKQSGRNRVVSAGYDEPLPLAA